MRVRATAAERPYIPLADAPAILEPIEVHDEARFEPRIPPQASTAARGQIGPARDRSELSASEATSIPDLSC
jgi:hypothetical protein